MMLFRFADVLKVRRENGKANNFFNCVAIAINKKSDVSFAIRNLCTFLCLET